MSTAVIKPEPISMPIPRPQSEAAALLGMIERASRDPSVDIPKMRELMAMRKEILAEQAASAFNDAMAKAQSEMLPVAADSNNPQTKSKYASYVALDHTLRPIYTRYGFGLSFNTTPSPTENHIRVICYVTNCGHTREYAVDMPADGKGAKGGDVMTKTHAVGSAMTYAQRYLLKLIFNIAVGEIDDDGNSAGNGGEKINEDQLALLIKLADDVGADKARFCKYLKISSLAELPAVKLQSAIDALEQKRKAS